MNRRKLLKLMSLAGFGPVLAGLPSWQADDLSSSYFLITDRPTTDLPRILRLAGMDTRTPPNISTFPVQPAPQDLSILHDGLLVDPLRAQGLSTRLADFAGELRARTQPGRVLLSIEPMPHRPDDAVTFASDGAVYERISLHANYRHIEIPGAVGITTFCLEDGRLSVVASSCRHQLCKKMGARTSGKMICAPNRLVATLPGRPGRVDAVTG